MSKDKREDAMSINDDERERRKALLERARGANGAEAWLRIMIELRLVREERSKFQASEDTRRVAGLNQSEEKREEVFNRLVDLWAIGELSPELRERILFGTEH
jgi:hypothetical protein